MSNYQQAPRVADATRFTRAPMSEVEFSRMTAVPNHLTTFNGGDIVPIYYKEVLPHETVSFSIDSVIRQTTSLRPAMGELFLDLYAYFVPNRIINESWKNVQGENTSGVWTAPEVDLVPLWSLNNPNSAVQVPVGSVADYYGFPTQRPIRSVHLAQMNDLKFRGYLEIYNNYFRDQNYQPPVPYSKLNVHNGFFEAEGTRINLADGYIAPSGVSSTHIEVGQVSDGSTGQGAILKAIYGEGYTAPTDSYLGYLLTTFSALGKPLKANKLHDAFTSALPSPQKGPEVFFGIGDVAPVSITTGTAVNDFNGLLRLKFNQDLTSGETAILAVQNGNFTQNRPDGIPYASPNSAGTTGTARYIVGSNLVGEADLSQATGVSINDLREAAAVQQVYEILARGGSRYTSVLASMFGIETANPFVDIPLELGHIRRTLDLYQVAQTSATDDSDTPQGTLTAYGYSTPNGHLFDRTFVEHGYIHVFAIVRQRNVYSTYLAPDNFRLNTMDFYLPPLANIGEQPIPLRTLNPFVDGTDKYIGYQEAWWEYRYEPDRISGEFRSGINGSQDIWHYGDSFDSTFDHINGDWLKSNAEEVINRTLAVDSSVSHQFKAQFTFMVDKNLPMPTYSIPGMDII